MRKFYLLLLLLLSVSKSNAQSTRLGGPAYNPVSVATPNLLIGVQSPPSLLFETYLFDDLRFQPYQITGLYSYLSTNGSLLFKSISYTPTSLEINTALGYTPYNGTTNTLGFLTSYSETDPTVGNHIKAITVGNISDWTSKQTLLVSGINIKTLESQSLLGSSNIDLGKTDVGLGNVDNTSDLNKPISTLTQTALNGKLSSEVDGSITNEIQTLLLSGNTLSISSGNSVNLPITDYTNTVAVAGGAGNAVFYLTSDKTSTGTALYTNVNYVNPVVNDSTVNYTYGWSYNAGTKALTVNVKQATGINVALVGLTLLGVPANVSNGTNILVLVKGN